jgi:uncharacterized membrane protein
MLSSGSVVYGEEEKKNLPPRDISLIPEYTGVMVPLEKYVNMDLTVKNGGRRGEDIDVSVFSLPDGWTAQIKTYSFRVTGVHVPSDDTKTLQFRADPVEKVEPGEYEFVIKAMTRDKKLTSTCQIKVTVIEEKEEKKVEGVNLQTSYPVLQGPTDAKFEFSVEVENKTGKENIFNLIPQGPENWEVRFKPAYEDKYFSSLRIKDGQKETMAVEVKPYLYAEPGQYSILVKVNTEGSSGEVELMVVLTGTYKIDIGTADGLLSLNAMRGEESNFSFYVVNNGSAKIDNLNFLSFKPENWQVEFNPKNIEMINPNDRKQVEVKITPAEQALVGDYSVVLSVEGAKEPKNLELRVTVKASTAWGWVGIGIIVVVLAGLVFLFIRFGRR